MFPRAGRWLGKRVYVLWWDVRYGEEGQVSLYQAPQTLIRTILSQTHPNNCRDPKGKINA